MPDSVILQRIPTPTAQPLVSGVLDTTFTGNVTIANTTSQLVDSNGAPLKLSGGTAPQILLVHPTDPPVGAHRVSAGMLSIPAGGTPSVALWTPGATGSYISSVAFLLDLLTATGHLHVVFAVMQGATTLLGTALTDVWAQLALGAHGAAAAGGTGLTLQVSNTTANATVDLYYTVTGVDLQV